jgi:preprotein translocase subunit SecA
MSTPALHHFARRHGPSEHSDQHDGAVPPLWAPDPAEAAVSGAGTSPPPARMLAALAIHRPEHNVPWLDRQGHRIFALWRRLRQPVQKLRQRAQAIQQETARWQEGSDDDLRAHLRELAANCRLAGAGQQAAATEALEAALGGVALAVQRVHGFAPHVEQLMGALTLLEGRMAEMATGEGKTLTAAMAAVVAAWHGLPCHVVTANDYLARRDAEIGQALFAFCQVSAASVDGDTAPPARAAAYGHDIVYCTAKELLGDYLRDGLALGKNPSASRYALSAARAGGRVGGAGVGQGVVLRGLFQVSVDEADSVLIDEAVTPLIISSQRPDDLLEQAAHDAVRLARQLTSGSDYKIEPALRHVELTQTGKEHLDQLASAMAPFWRHRERARELVEMALYATELLVRDQHYVVEEEKIVLVDELTGRLANQRTLSLGMQQILEASQGLPISPPSEVSARLSFQRFFRRFARLGGMTGTAEEAAREFAQVYRLSTLRIPTHRPVQRAMGAWCICRDQQEKFDAIAASAKALVGQGRAVLIGMRSVKSSEALHARLQALHPELSVQVLHAVNHRQEASIEAQAGQPGALTIATNMAGRGTDIALDAGVRERGGLHVIIGESNDYARIDRQLIGRCARQSDPGSVQRFIALDDELLRRFVPAPLARAWAWLHQRRPAWAPQLAAAALRLAQWRAERQAFGQRQNILKQDIELDRSGF